ncbi:MAG TPA: STAS domain-containing protein [Terriglobales bacterium]|jgi:anti-anti-sigma factor|nr:STAS domain-containing protein [Terriglobales bacterium]
MALTLQVHSQRQVTVLVCKGTIVFGLESDCLRAKVKELLCQKNSSDSPVADPAAAPCASFVLDLSQVQYIDSGGLGALVAVLTSARAAGGDLRLTGMNERVSRVLKTTRLDRVFRTHSSVELAVNAFHARATVQK